MSEGPRALVVSSSGAEPGAVCALIAALEVAGVRVRALDVGRVGARSSGAVDRVLRAVVGELAERHLGRALVEEPPDVAVGFDPGTVSVLGAARDEAARPFPVVAVVPELSPGADWGGTDADRYLAVDDEAAVRLSDAGVAGERVVAVGPIAEAAFAAAAAEDRAAVRQRFKLPASGRVLLVEVAGLGYEQASQVALQLSLVGSDAVFLFDAGHDADAATALRQQVPTLDMKAKLFGATADAPLLWRAADVVVARPTPRAVARVLSLGSRMVATAAGEGGEERARALEDRQRARLAASPLLIGSALESLLSAAAPGTPSAVDGAGTAADAIWILGDERQSAVDERRSSASRQRQARVEQVAGAAERAAARAAPPGDLEDLGGGFAGDAGSSGGAAPDPVEIARLLREIRGRRERAQRTISDAQRGAAEWERKQALADEHGNADMGRHAARNAELERARMHGALAEMAELEDEERRLEQAAANAAKAPPPPRQAPPRARAASSSPGGGGTSVHARRSVDDELESLKRRAGGAAGASSAPRASSGGGKGGSRRSTVDDELEALKRKMAQRRKP